MNHPQNDFGQVGAQNFRGSKAGAGLIVVFGEKPETDPVLHPAAAAFALVAAAFRNRYHRQGGGARAGGIPGDTCQSRVNDVSDSRNGNGGFGHIGSDNDFFLRQTGKDAGLIGRRQPGEQGHHAGAGRFFSFNEFAGFTDVLLAGHKHQHVTGAALLQNAPDGLHGQLHMGRVVGL